MIDAPWRCEPDEIARRLDVDPTHGLDPGTARSRLEETGPNRLVEPAPRPWWRLLLAQVANPLAVTLAVAAAVAGSVERSYREATAIGVALALNGVLGFMQERRSGRAVAELKHMLDPSARVRRDGTALSVPAADLVPGDVVLVRAGDRIPADGRVLRAANLEVDESGLTGETVPVAKSAAALDGEAGLADRTSMCHMTSTVTRGSGELLVTATGMRTEVGRVADLLAHTSTEPTPLQRQLDRLGFRLALLAGVAVVAVAAMLWLAGGSLGEVITVAVALGVAAIPEGLPAAVAVTLTLGMRKMARERAIVKRLPAVETLGATTVICTDKTGTLTVNRMTARSVWYAGRDRAITSPDDGVALRDLLVPAVLCGDAVVRDGAVIGDPIEGALVMLAERAGLDVAAERVAAPRVAEIPFDAELRYMATFHDVGAGTQVCVKGAADVLLALAARVRTELGDIELTPSSRTRLAAEIDRLAGQGERVLAVAVGDAAAGAGAVLPADLLLLGLIGVADPPRPEAAAAIAECRAAGIDVKMITGDHPATANAVGRRRRSSPAMRCRAGTSNFSTTRPWRRLKHCSHQRAPGLQLMSSVTRRRQRRAGAQGRGHRRRDGPHRIGRGQGGRLDDPRRRQLRHHRHRRPPRAHHPRQHRQVRPFPGQHQCRRDHRDGRRRGAAGRRQPDDAADAVVGQRDRRRAAGAGARLGTGTSRGDEGTAPAPRRADPDRPPPGLDHRRRCGDGRGHARRILARAATWRAHRTDPGLHHLRVLPAGQPAQCPGRTRQRVGTAAGAQLAAVGGDGRRRRPAGDRRSPTGRAGPVRHHRPRTGRLAGRPGHRRHGAVPGGTAQSGQEKATTLLPHSHRGHIERSPDYAMVITDDSSRSRRKS
ncbi:calcium-translocating P-type ATPase, PMCA-type [Kutzneria sp. 744]|nr:calcium-translocating P-type ATPase, PMCA-type [Kutzneria sp. 744]